MIFIATHDKLENVHNILYALSKNKSLKIFNIRVIIGVSGQNLDFIRLNLFDVKYIQLPSYYYWARSLKSIILSAQKEDYKYAIHINDDVEAEQLVQLDLASSMKSNTISYGCFKDIQEEIIFGGYKLSGMKAVLSNECVQLFNGNFFSAPKNILQNALPSFTFQHAYLDFILSYRMIKKNKNINIVKNNFYSNNEYLEDRLKTKKAYKSFWYSRANPLDAFMYYFYLGKFMTAPIVFLYLFYRVLKNYLMSRK